MTRAAAWLGRRLRRLARREDGASTVAFALIFPVVIGLIFATLEVGLFMTRQVMLERGVDLALRDLRLGAVEDPSQEKLRSAICERTVIIRDCEQVLLLELRPVDTSSWAGLTDPVACIERAEEITPVTQFVAGQQNELMLVRACAIIDPILPGGTMALAMPRDPSGGFRMVASSAFVNEPS